MKRQLVIRLEEDQLAVLKEAAAHFRESVQEFAVRSLLLRLQTRKDPVLVNPFEQALDGIRREKPRRELSPAAAAAVREGRKAFERGTLATATVEEALRELDPGVLQEMGIRSKAGSKGRA